MTSIILENLAHAYRPNPSSPADYALKQATQIWESGGAYALLGRSRRHHRSAAQAREREAEG